MDYSKYIGLPFVKGGRYLKRDGGLDCYGLVALVYEQEKGLLLPDYQGIFLGEGNYEECTSTIYESPTYKDFIEVQNEKEGDILLFTVGGYPVHITICIGNNLMLHTTKDTGSVVENYRGLKWKRRYHSAYRYQKNQ